MDIQYLLWLQELRNATGGIFNEFFNALSKFAVEIMPLLPFVVFWCADKKWGYRFISSWGIGEVLNGIIKLTVCAYRPWIRSDLIEPAGDSKVAATGYSFPQRPYDGCYRHLWYRLCLAEGQKKMDFRSLRSAHCIDSVF